MSVNLEKIDCGLEPTGAAVVLDGAPACLEDSGPALDCLAASADLVVFLAMESCG